MRLKIYFTTHEEIGLICVLVRMSNKKLYLMGANLLIIALVKLET
jgi:hypothetical protein